MSVLFIVGKSGPVFEADLNSSGAKRDESGNHRNEFVVHAALDLIEEAKWNTSNMYLKVVDKFNDQSVSAFVTASQSVLVLLHEGKHEDTVKAFFNDVYELYIKPNPAAATDAGAAASAESAIVLTPAQKVKAAGNVMLNLGIIGLTVTCGYFIVRELFPSRMNPNGLFSEAFEAVKADPEVTQLLGSPLKGYGEDRGGHRSGRRNFVENVVIPGVPEKAGGRSSLRIRFNVEGPYGHGFVFAEAREGSSKGDWIYLMVQSTKTGKTTVIHDNRNQLLDDETQSGGVKDAIRALISGGGSK